MKAEKDFETNEQAKDKYLENAKQYYKLGWVPLPKKVGAKYPKSGWKRFQTERPSLPELEHIFEEYTDGICLIQGPHAGTFVIDVDIRDGKDGKEALHDLQMQFEDLPETVTAKTSKGSWHYYYKYPSSYVPSATGIREGIDVRAAGGLVVAPPSIHPDTGKPYKWLEGHSPSDMEPAEAPQWLIDVILNATAYKNTGWTGGAFKHSNDNRRSDGREGFMFRLVAQHLRATVVDLFSPPRVDEVFRAVWPKYVKAVSPRDGSTLEEEGRGETALRKKIQYALRPERLRRILSGKWDDKSAFSSEHKQESNDDEFILGQNGKILNNLANARVALSHIGEFQYDEMAKEIISSPKTVCPQLRQFSDEDVLRYQIELQKGPLPCVGKETTHDAIIVVAKSNSFHPIRDKLESLEWDGQPRLDSWLARYMAADSTRYTEIVGPKFLISMVARILWPGCKVDHMLILEGPQGIGKSTCCRIMSGDEWFSDAIPTDIRSKEASQHISTKWLIEIPELAVMYKREAEELKSFLSRQEEMYRPPYARVEVKEPRQCVFVGTTNASEYLRDSTGGRRFWPVTVRQCDFEALETDRDQLLAEAVHRCKSGEKWWPKKDWEIELLSDHQEARREADPWEERIEKFLAMRDETSLDDIWVCLGFEISQRKYADQRRIVNTMEALGWEKYRTSNARRWRKRDTGDAGVTGLAS